MKRAFTLIEVNLAIMVMAVGVLGIISLYALGYREERQSREDVASASYADAVMGPLVTALTATNVKWSAFRKIPDSPGADGWGHYIQNRNTGKIVSNPESLAQQAYTKTLTSVLSVESMARFLSCGLDPPDFSFQIETVLWSSFFQG